MRSPTNSELTCTAFSRPDTDPGPKPGRIVAIASFLPATVMEASFEKVYLVMDLADEEFYRKHADSLLRLSVSLVGPSHGEDIFSTAVLNVLRAASWPRLHDEEKRAYMYRSVVNEARRWVGRVGRRTAREVVYSAQHLVPSDVVEAPEVWEALASLSVRQRAVVYLVYWEDLDTRTVASRLEISEGSVYQHLDRARKMLKRRLDV